MSIAERDYILRLIEQFAAALARIVSLREKGDIDGATESAQQSADQIFGPVARSLDELDPRGVGLMVQDPAKLTMYAELTRERAAIALAAGRTDSASRLRARALAVLVEAAERAPGSEIVLGHIEALRPEVDEAYLDPITRGALAKLRTGLPEGR